MEKLDTGLETLNANRLANKGGKGDGKNDRSSGKASKGDGKGDRGHTAFVVNHATDFGTSVSKKPHFVMTVHRAPHSVLLATQDSAGYMIVDTACQRTCCGETWFESHCNLLVGNDSLFCSTSVLKSFSSGPVTLRSATPTHVSLRASAASVSFWAHTCSFSRCWFAWEPVHARHGMRVGYPPQAGLHEGTWLRGCAGHRWRSPCHKHLGLPQRLPQPPSLGSN